MNPRELMAMRLGRADLLSLQFQNYGPAQNGAIGVDISGTPNAGYAAMGDMTIGRLGLAIVLVYVGAIATAYLATRARQY